MRPLTTVIDGLKATAARPPGMEAMEAAARRAADRTNSQFAQAHVPIRAVVVRKAQGFRLMLNQTGRLTRPFAGITPMQLLRDNVHREMQTAKVQIARELKDILK